MREITSHIVNPANDTLKVTVLDEPGAGGANHLYEVTGGTAYCSVVFQNGAITEHGVNGVTQEVLLAIVIDRLQSFQKGPFSSRENALALTHLQEAQHWLFARTLERMQRGVEGKTLA